jgi:hypothetical protein
LCICCISLYTVVHLVPLVEPWRPAFWQPWLSFLNPHRHSPLLRLWGLKILRAIFLWSKIAFVNSSVFRCSFAL